MAGFTPHQIAPENDRDLLAFGCGLTTALARPTRRADELSHEELTGAAEVLRRKMERYTPRTIAFLGKAAYAAIVGRREIPWGPQAGRSAGAAVQGVKGGGGG